MTVSGLQRRGRIREQPVARISAGTVGGGARREEPIACESMQERGLGRRHSAENTNNTRNEVAPLFQVGFTAQNTSP